jgi:hypothetical protein
MMLMLLCIVALVVLAYLALVRRQIQKPRQFRYSPRLAPVLRYWLAGRGMVCLTLWHTCWLFMPDGTPGFTLADHGRAHEHVHMDQFDRWPFTFPFRYLWELLRHGYAGNRFEVEARTAAGEPPMGAA